MNRRRLLLIAAVWLATVVTASSATWAVISATGTRVGQAVPLSAPSPVHTTAAPSAAASPTPTASHAPSTSTSTSTPKPTTTKTRHSTAPSNPEQTITGSWNGEAGTVTASCTGSAVSLVSAVPAVGYRVQVERSRSELQVEFEGNHESNETHLKVTCVDGKPNFRRD